MLIEANRPAALATVVDRVVEHLRGDGVRDASRLMARVHAPIGLDLGGTTPAEIALAILAEIEMVRHQGVQISRSQK